MDELVLITVIVCYVAMSVVSFCAYAIDKRAATRGRRRVPERTLLTIDLLGGWPGGWIGRRAFRHKTRKLSYRAMFSLVVLVHVAAWAAWWWVVRGSG